MTTAEALRTIVDGLNSEPFNKKLNLISFDSMSSSGLLQLFSDIIQWINTEPSIDIREESPDETAIRIFNSLRILKYKPPTDIEQLQEWRRGIVEGEKSAVYPVLEWIFKDPEPIKERAYLAKYLVKVDIPGEFQDGELLELQNEVSNLMEEFKDVHSRLIEIRKDTLITDDIRSDLKTMEQEKEQLNRRIEKIERKLRSVPNVERYLELAKKCRLENEKQEKIAIHRQEQRNALVHNEQKLKRLNTTLKGIFSANANNDPTEAMNRLKEEIETTRYMVQEKLPKEIESKRVIIAELSKVADLPAIDSNDIKELESKIDEVNEEIMAMINERDRRDETTDKLSIYRHQASAVARKKNITAQKLHELRGELQQLESMVELKKNELKDKSGGSDVISSVQFKNYVNKLRSKTASYKKKRAEIDDLKGENTILARTQDILKVKWNSLKERIESSGCTITELNTASNQYERPKTAKPSSENVDELKRMIKELSDRIDEKKNVNTELTDSCSQLNSEFLELNDKYSAKRRTYESMAATLENEFSRLQEDVKSMEQQLSTVNWKVFRSEIELEIQNAIIERLNDEQNGDQPKLAELIENEISRANMETENLNRQNSSSLPAGRSYEEAAEQVLMWRSLIKILSAKLKNKQNSSSQSQSNPQHQQIELSADTPIGDSNPTSANRAGTVRRPVSRAMHRT